MNNDNDPYRFADITQTEEQAGLRRDIDLYFDEAVGSNSEKFKAFPKFIRRQTMARFLARIEIFKMVLNVQGNIIDCGVLFGGSIMTWAKASAIFEPVNSQRKIIGFDTFEGFVSLSDQDKTSISTESKVGGFKIEGGDIYKDIEESIRLFDRDRQIPHIPKVELIKGDIAETAVKYLEDNPHTIVSLLHLDVDIYEPTKVALEHFVPRMPKGAIIVFDELNSPYWPGESIALLESLNINELEIKRFPWDSYFSYAVL